MHATQASLLIHPGKINVIQEFTIPTSPDENKTYQERYAHTFKLSPKLDYKNTADHSEKQCSSNKSHEELWTIHLLHNQNKEEQILTTTLECTHRGNDFSNLISTYKLSKTLPKYPSSMMRHECMNVMCEQ
jgi:hypothetical protein